MTSVELGDIVVCRFGTEDSYFRARVVELKVLQLNVKQGYIFTFVFRRAVVMVVSPLLMYTL